MLSPTSTDKFAVAARTSTTMYSTRTTLSVPIVLCLIMFACERSAPELPKQPSEGVAPDDHSARLTEGVALEIGLAQAVERGYVKDRSRIFVHSRRYDVTDRYWSFEVGPAEPSPGLQAWLRVHDDGRVEWFQ